MKKQFHFSGKLRHLKNISCKLNLIKDKSSSVFQKTLHRFFELIHQLKKVFSFSFLKKFAVGTAFTFLLSSQNAEAQIVFDTLETNPFSFVKPANAAYLLPAFADLDSDGDIDMLIGFYNGTNWRLKYFKNTGTATSPIFTSNANPPGLVGFQTVEFLAPEFADIDNDGDMDLFCGSNDTSYLYAGKILYFQNTGTASSASFAAPIINPFGLSFPANSYYSLISIADIDNDGDLDILSSVSYDMSLFINTGTSSTPSFASGQSGAFGIPTGVTSVPSFSDLDNDGDEELFYYTPGTQPLQFMTDSVYGGAPHFNAAASNPYGLFSDSTMLKPIFVDIDNDGDQDFLWGDYSGDLKFQRNISFAASVKTMDDFSIEIFPNPVVSNLIISSPNGFEKNTEIEIRNILGQLLYEVKISANEKTKQINVSQLASGTYCVQVKRNKESVSKTFIKK